MGDLAGIGVIIYFVLMVVMRIPELLVLFLGLVVLLVGLALVEVVGKAVLRFVSGEKSRPRTEDDA
ncbi:MAG: hypothetical protein IJT82_04780 [Schwartzia sp.]|nr:hypothetical protein [Schwartzia sp. (in: firmicutes)]